MMSGYDLAMVVEIVTVVGKEAGASQHWLSVSLFG